MTTAVAAQQIAPDNRCPCCGRPSSGVKTFEGFMSRLFITAVQGSERRTVSWVEHIGDELSQKKEALLDDIVLASALRKMGHTTFYARLGDLKHWGLLTQWPSWNHQGIYQVSVTGKLFLLGRKSIPRWVRVSHQGKVIERSEEMVTLQDALSDGWNDIAGWISEWRGRHLLSQSELSALEADSQLKLF